VRLAIVRRRYAHFGGAERFIQTTAAALARQGVKVNIVSEQWQGVGDTVLEHVTVPSRGLTRHGALQNFQRNVAIIIGRENFDLVQTHERLLTADIFRAGDGVHAAWVKRQSAERGRWRASLMRFDAMHNLVMDTEKRMARETDMMFVANSALVAREIADWLGVPASRVRVIENGVDLHTYRQPSAEERAAARQQFGIPDDAPVVAFVGSGFERKGVFQLVEALALPACGHLRALIAGRDRKLEALRRRVETLGLSDRVQVLGGIEGSLTIYQAADVFALPSLYDPMPNAALEALACGLPIVTTADTGIADHVAANGAGVVVTRSPDFIAAGLKEAAAKRDAMSAAALVLAPRFDLNDATKRWLALYRELA
jgi:UDP-glucose:(heptosyl)LPS alpha-1,3-glucosyltransferase